MTFAMNLMFVWQVQHIDGGVDQSSQEGLRTRGQTLQCAAYVYETWTKLIVNNQYCIMFSFPDNKLPLLPKKTLSVVKQIDSQSKDIWTWLDSLQFRL